MYRPTMHAFRRVFAVALLTTALAGCGGAKETTRPTDGEADGDSTSAVNPTPTFQPDFESGQLRPGRMEEDVWLTGGHREDHRV